MYFFCLVGKIPPIPLGRKSLYMIADVEAFMNYDFSYTRFCVRKTVLNACLMHVGNHVHKRADMHVTNNNMIQQ